MQKLDANNTEKYECDYCDAELKDNYIRIYYNQEVGNLEAGGYEVCCEECAKTAVKDFPEEILKFEKVTITRQVEEVVF